MNKFLAALVVSLGTELVEKVFKPLFLMIPEKIKQYLENRKKKKQIEVFKDAPKKPGHTDHFSDLP